MMKTPTIQHLEFLRQQGLYLVICSLLLLCFQSCCKTEPYIYCDQKYAKDTGDGECRCIEGSVELLGVCQPTLEEMPNYHLYPGQEDFICKRYYLEEAPYGFDSTIFNFRCFPSDLVPGALDTTAAGSMISGGYKWDRATISKVWNNGFHNTSYQEGRDFILIGDESSNFAYIYRDIDGIYHFNAPFTFAGILANIEDAGPSDHLSLWRGTFSPNLDTLSVRVKILSKVVEGGVYYFEADYIEY